MLVVAELAEDLAWITRRRLQLERGVRDLVALGQDAIHRAKDRARLAHWLIADEDVSTGRSNRRRDAPEVQVVDIEDAWDRAHRGLDRSGVEVSWGRFEQDVDRLDNDLPTRPENEQKNQDG